MSHRQARLGFIGAGWWATEVQLPYFARRADVELVSVCRLGQLVRLAKEKHRHLLVPQSWNFMPYVREASRLTRG